MVTLNMLRTCEGISLNIFKNCDCSRFKQMPCLDQTDFTPYKCATISEIPSNIGSMSLIKLILNKQLAIQSSMDKPNN